MKEKRKIDRREFLKIVGAGAVAGTAALYGCGGRQGASSQTAAQRDVPTDKMTYRTSSASGDRVSLLGYGCMRWPTTSEDEGTREVINQEMVNELVDYAIAHGVNYFDTAPVYLHGFSERATGIALKRHPRDKWLIATKMSNFRNPTRQNSLALYYKSFEELQVDYIDYYLLHSLGTELSEFKARFIDNGVLDFLIAEREAGRIRNLGWSFHGSKEVYEYVLAMDIKWDFVQIQMNYMDWTHASGQNLNADYLYAELEKRAIPVVVMEPLLGGALAKLNDHLVAKLKEYRPTQTAAAWAFRYVGSFPKVLTVLSGMTYMEHLQDNLRTYSPLDPISCEERAVLDEVVESLLKFPTIPCTDCKYCMPCPYGLNIPAIFAHYNRCVNEGTLPEDSQDPIYAEARRAFLIGYDRSVPKLRQASHCIGCSKCVEQCPQQIKIPQQMMRIDRYVEQLKQGKL